MVEDYPSISLVHSYSQSSLYSYGQNYSYYGANKLSPRKRLEEEKVVDGDLLLIQRKSVIDLISDCTHKIREMYYQLATVRDGTDFLKNIRYIEDGQHLSTSVTETVRWVQTEQSRPQVALLYTDEDVHIASYVRTNFDSLDKASGNDCDVLFIENPREIEPSIYWRGILDEFSYIIWRSLGWERSKPYNKADVYDLAKAFGIPLDTLPCALVFENGILRYDSIIKLEANLTTVFRKMFAKFQEKPHIKDFDVRHDRCTTRSIRRKMTDEDGQKPICFLSHNSRDKNTVRKVAASLHTFGIDTWFYECEFLPGDSIVGKVEEGLRKASHIIIFLSRTAVSSNWVAEEMNAALYHAISTKKLVVIPILLEDCDILMIIGSYAHIRESNSHEIAINIQHAILGITRKPRVVITA